MIVFLYDLMIILLMIVSVESHLNNTHEASESYINRFNISSGRKGNKPAKSQQREIRKSCRYLMKIHHVVPGLSWGTLSLSEQQKWLDWHCDRFFCHKHHLEGKGIYDCKRLPLAQSGEEGPED